MKSEKLLKTVQEMNQRTKQKLRFLYRKSQNPYGYHYYFNEVEENEPIGKNLKENH